MPRRATTTPARSPGAARQARTDPRGYQTRAADPRKRPLRAQLASRHTTPTLVDAASSPPAEDLIDLCPSRTFSPSGLQALVAGAGTCSFVTDWPPIKDPKFVNLYVGDQLRPILLVRDMLPVSDGWRLESDGRTVTLLGAACADAQAGAMITLEAACDWGILR